MFAIRIFAIGIYFFGKIRTFSHFVIVKFFHTAFCVQVRRMCFP